MPPGDKKRKATNQPLQDCPITGFPINDKLVKKLKSSTQVTKATLSNVLQSKLGWPPHRVNDTWTKETLIQEYYAALEMQKAQQAALSPARQSPMSSSPVSVRFPSPAMPAPTSAPRGSVRNRAASASAPQWSPPSSRRVAPIPEARAPVASSPPVIQRSTGRSAVHTSSQRKAAKPPGRSWLSSMLQLLLVLVLAMIFVIYLVHGFEGGTKKLIAGAQGDMVANYQGLAKDTLGLARTTLYGYFSLLLEKLLALYTQAYDYVTGLVAQVSVASKSGASLPRLEEGKKEPEKAKSVPNPAVRVAAPATPPPEDSQTQKAAQDENEKAQQYERRKQAAQKAEEQERVAKAQEAQRQREQEDKSKAENAAAQAAAARQAQASAQEEVQQAEAPNTNKQRKKKKGPSDTEKIQAWSCDAFDVYDCDVQFPKLFDACRAKKKQCEPSS